MNIHRFWLSAAAYIATMAASNTDFSVSTIEWSSFVSHFTAMRVPRGYLPVAIEPSPICRSVSCRMSQKEIDHAIRTTFRNPPILVSEDRALYEDLKRLVLSHIKPRGLPEALLARDILEAEWEVCRLRWMKVAILHAVLPRVIKSLILEAGGTRSLERRLVPKICKHVVAVVSGDPQARQQLETLLEPHKLTLDLIVAAAFDDRIVSQLHIDRMTTTAWERRIAAYAELERLRTTSRKPEAPGDQVLEIEHEGHPTVPIDGGGGG